MQELLHLQDKIRTTGAAIGRLSAELSRNPESRGIESNLLSLRKLHRNLSLDFQNAADAVGFDICHYKVLDDRPTVRTLSRTLAGFQDAFSMMFASLQGQQPMQRRAVSRGVLNETELRVAYTVPGSFGVVLTAPREMVLFEEWGTKADRAIDTMFQVARARTSGEVAQVARQLGRAPIAAMYDWAKASADSKAGAEVSWNLHKESSKALLVQYPQFDELFRSIEATSEEQTQDKDIKGSLVGADMKSRRFHFVAEDDTDIRGRFIDAISESQKAQLPARYVASLRVRTKVNFATAEEDVSYDLLRLLLLT